MTKTILTKDYNNLSEIFFNWLSKENTTFTIEKAIEELGIYVKGYKRMRSSITTGLILSHLIILRTPLSVGRIQFILLQLKSQRNLFM